MRRPLLAALAAVLAALVLLFAFSAWLLSRNLESARRQGEARMAGLAAYIGERLAEDPFSYPLAWGPVQAPEAQAREQTGWLGRLTRAAGLERAVLTDSAGIVHASSQDLLQSGEDIRPYLLDTALFAAAARDGRPRFTPLAEIDGVPFQSLYHPVTLRGMRRVIVLESDQAVMASAEALRGYVAPASLFLLAVFVVLAAGLLALDRKVQAALAESRRNERLAFLGRISAELAHEIRNPLGIIKSSVDVLRRRYDPAREQPAFDFVSDEVMRLSRLIGGILGFSRERPLEERPFSPREALESLRAPHAHDFPGVELDLEVPEHLVLLGDRDAFRQVAENLVRNASAAMGGKGRARISAEARGRGVALLFADTGPGLPPAVKARLFEPFVSGSRTGTGLGLSIVRSLCERGGWTVRLASNAADGKGETRFEVLVPKSRVAEGPGGGSRP